jgi:hypothetical protein
VRAEFTIEKGKIEEFKKLIRDMSKMVENDEPDTINYQFYLNRSETKCMVHETQKFRKCTCSHYWRCIENNTSKDFQYRKAK